MCKVELSLGYLLAHLWLPVTTRYSAAAMMKDENLAYLKQPNWKKFTPDLRGKESHSLL